MSQFIGRRSDLAVYANDTNYVEIDTNLNVVVASGYTSDIEPSELVKTFEDHDGSLKELASSALSLLGPKPLTAAARLYTIPEGVKKEAKKSLEWRKEYKRGGTPVGLNTARTLARGGQIGIEKVRHIAKYFPRHEVDKKGKGWKPSEDEFPSNGRIAWALWGGDSGWRWARAIVEREEKKALKADGYIQEIGSDLSPFNMAELYDESVAPEFLARVCMDGSGIDRVYKVDLDGAVYVWDDGAWDNAGIMGGDIWVYDDSLDEMRGDDDSVSHIVIDPDSAIVVCAKLQNNPFKKVLISEIDPEEYELFEGYEDDDDGELDFIDEVVVAALPPQAPADGYTSEERSQNVKKQPRDARGLFVQVGKQVVVGGDTQNGLGEIKSVNDDGTVTVTMKNGQEINVSSKSVETYKDGQAPAPTQIGMPPASDEPIDLSGIIGEPRTPQNMPKARLPGTLPPISASDLHSVIKDWDGWVQSQRAQFKPAKESGGDHPLLKRLANRGGGNSKRKPVSDSSNAWAKPVTAAAEAKPSDVQPLYLAVVSPEDPRAVMDLISVVPASATSNAPMTYVRKEEKWVRDPQFLEDLKSATPPPVVPLNPEVLQEVLKQVDSITASAYNHSLMVLWGPRKDVMESKEAEFAADLETLFAVGGLDKNRGQAENLRRYWTTGKGALKIRWGTPGDWKRCVKYLSKYLGVRSKGYCQLRHKDATGVYTGSRQNPGNENAMEEPMYGFPGVDTIEITEDDLLTPLDDFFKEPDDIYEANWEPEDEIVNALKELNKCGDDEFEALVAAGWWEGNGRKARRLKRYWTRGKGGRAKIRWNSGGDWYRCVRNLTKYLGPRAKGYCALRHKEVTGMWTGDRAHLIKYGGRVGGRANFANDTLKSSEQILSEFTLRARVSELKNSVGLVAAGFLRLTASGDLICTFHLLFQKTLESGDGTQVSKKGAISWRELPTTAYVAN
jgi:hypothetical protein